MLIRISRNSSGIVDYLVNGNKSERFLSRDELDHRSILSGDIDELDRILNTFIEEGKDNYLHLTFSFYENDIDEQTLEAINQEVKDFFLATAKHDEFYFYSEAHLPKIRTEYDRHGNLVERKPHIHAVIPLFNLATGEREEPLGYGEQFIREFDAFQEYLNVTYDLASPKDRSHKRVIYGSQEDALHRWKEHEHTTRKDIKSAVFDIIQHREDIQDLETLQNVLDKEFAIKSRIVTKTKHEHGAYLQIQNEQQNKRSINLKEAVFSAKYLANRNTQEATLAKEMRTYEHDFDIAARKSLSELEARVKEWKEFTADYARFVSTKSPKFRNEFRAKSVEEKERFFASMHERHHHRWQGTHPKDQALERARFIVRDLEEIQDISNLKDIGAIDGIINDTDQMYELHPRGENAHSSERQRADNPSILPRDSRLHMEGDGKTAYRGLQLSRRRSNSRSRRFHEPAGSSVWRSDGTDERRANGSGVSDSRTNIDNRDKNRSAETVEKMNQLNAQFFLTYCLEGFSFNETDCRAFKNHLGKPRVEYAGKTYSPTDFLRKICHLNYAETQQVIDEVHELQTQHQIKEMPPHRRMINHKLNAQHYEHLRKQFEQLKKSRYVYDKRKSKAENNELRRAFYAVKKEQRRRLIETARRKRANDFISQLRWQNIQKERAQEQQAQNRELIKEHLANQQEGQKKPEKT